MILIVTILALFICVLNYYYILPIDKYLFFVYSSISLLILIITICYIIIKNKKNKQNKVILEEINNLCNFSSSCNLGDLKQMLKNKLNVLEISLKDKEKQNFILVNKINCILKSLKYLKNENNISFIQKLQTQYKDLIFLKENNIAFNNLKIAIINNDELENFLLQNILLEFNIYSEIFNNIQDIPDDFSLIISKNNIEKGNILCYTFTHIDIKALLSFLQENFSHLCITKERDFNVLIFKSSVFENDLFLNITNQYFSHNNAVQYLHDFKNSLEKNYKLILLDYEVIKYDIKLVKTILENYKIKNPHASILLFSKDRVKGCEFADEILNDINKNEWILLLKKHINQA
ncbi:hypothetical protein [Campylobacter armoricus]|uniref:hypothetical protein n=1 Tax=Campylobacter armoricus TaxID=2505970 RepID=UPI001117700C|nr:hypothetical protein [Campylobacter armoricus]